MITVILNGYKRPDNLNEQLEALNNQTVKPDEIMLWYNHPDDDKLNYDIGTQIPVAYCNYNFGVWSRFYFAMNASNPYVCVFDDDTIPGSRWLENCLGTMKTHEGLLGTVGLLYLNPLPPEKSSYYEHYIRFGWVPNGLQNENTTQVDLVGHSWFFKREWLSYMVRELPHPRYNTCGEDMHFSYMLQKYANIPTYVPPHPKDNQEMWGSVKGLYGDDQTSMWNSNKLGNDGTPFKELMDQYFHEQRKKGWKLVNER
jgi:hypothetical protein